MQGETRVKLIFDPYRICTAGGCRVADFRGERQAFREIEDLLRKDARHETIQPKTYIIEGRCWEHFQSFRSVKGVLVDQVTPRGRVRDHFGLEPPDWMTDEFIHAARLGDRTPPTSLSGDNWAAAVAGWLLPGINEATSLDQWLQVVAKAAPVKPEAIIEPVRNWLVEQFGAVAAASITSREVVGILRAALAQSPTPNAFALTWVRRTALAPLLSHGVDNPLRLSGLEAISPHDLVVAKYLPLIFPLPDPVHAEVSQLMRRAVQQARVQGARSFEETVLALNGFWDGVVEELSAWVEVRPNAMTAKAAKQLASLPGYERNAAARRLVSYYAPPDEVPAWKELDDSFDGWVTAYARFAFHSFLRREIPEPSKDPAAPFGRWLKDHHTVSFTHPDRGYYRVAKAVQDALKRRRTVILIIIDALAIHALPEAIPYINDEMATQPTKTSYLFAPIPTITEVCKEAVLTGQFPSECNGNLGASLAKAYNLSQDQLVLAANWQDAERQQVTPNTKLLVYRDNRLDDLLKKAGSYRSVVEDYANIFPKIARLVGRWVRDFRCLSDTPPFVLLTADHGFTYGPRPLGEGAADAVIDGHCRCREVSARPTNLVQDGDAVTFIEREQFHLRAHYLAARSRCPGGRASGEWLLAHGGLLPEEVIIPVAEWFGDSVAIPWPEVSFPEDAVRDRDGWIVRFLVRNPHAVPIYGGTLKANVAGERRQASAAIPRLEAGATASLLCTLPGADLPEGEIVPVDVMITIRHGDAGREDSRPKPYLIPRSRKLVERTNEQAAFEDMF